MKRFLTIAAAMAAATPAVACNADMLEVLDWRAVAAEEGSYFPYDLSADVRYRGDRPYRMIHGGVMFDDVLGESLGQVNLERDQDVAPGEAILVDGLVEVDERIGTVNRDDVVYRTCVWSVVYAEGTTEKFD